MTAKIEYIEVNAMPVPKILFRSLLNPKNKKPMVTNFFSTSLDIIMYSPNKDTSEQTFITNRRSNDSRTA